jgi:uncharacterized protein
MPARRNRPPQIGAQRPPAEAPRPLDAQAPEALQAVLDRVPAPLEPLDVSALDGFLCGLLLQPQRVPEERWLAYVTDTEARPVPAGFDAAALHQLVRRRHAELDAAIAQRRWFDPWVFEFDEGEPVTPSQQVAPWVAGFALAQEVFPALMQSSQRVLTRPLALLYRHLDPDDLEDADELLEEIESLEPATDLAEAVEDLVQATLLLADVARPRAVAPRRGPRAPGR